MEATETPRKISQPGQAVIKGVSLDRSDDAIVLQAANAWGVKYSTALRRIINEWAAAQNETPGE